VLTGQNIWPKRYDPLANVMPEEETRRGCSTSRP